MDGRVPRSRTAVRYAAGDAHHRRDRGIRAGRRCCRGLRRVVEGRRHHDRPAGAAASAVASTGADATVVGTAGATSSPRPEATRAAPGDAVSVTGIVGTLSTGPDAIEITRLSGAAVNRVDVQDATVIRSAGGGRIDFAGIHTSDRIIADGHISDRGDALVADEITRERRRLRRRRSTEPEPPLSVHFSLQLPVSNGAAATLPWPLQNQ